VQTDRLGREKAVDRYLGQTHAAHSDFAYDLAGRLNDVTHKHGATTLDHYHLTLDANGQVSDFAKNATPDAYVHDGNGRVKSGAGGSFSYDVNGNRTDHSRATGADNRLVQDDLWTYEYDREGNRTRKTSRTGGEFWSYDFDQRNRMTAAEHRASDNTLLGRSTYNYDDADLRTSKQVDADGDGSIDLTGSVPADQSRPRHHLPAMTRGDMHAEP
jgi:YD repeat-containing protein